MTGSDVTPPQGGDVIVALSDERLAEYAVVTDTSSVTSCSSPSCSNLTFSESEDAKLGLEGDEAAAKAIVLSVIMVSAVLGNLLVIVSVLRYDRLRRVANSFIVSLAFADLLVAVLVMPFNASQVSRTCVLPIHSRRRRRRRRNMRAHACSLFARLFNIYSNDMTASKRLLVNFTSASGSFNF